MKDETVTVVARVEAQIEHLELVKAECLALVAPSRREPGCLRYDLFQAQENPAIFIFCEEWQSRDDLEAHLESAPCARFDANTVGKLAEPEEILFLSRISDIKEGLRTED